MSPEDAISHHRAGRLEDAEAAYRAALADEPENASILHNLGVAVAEQGRAEEALALFERALAAEPSYSSAHFNRAGALNSLGRLDEAADAYRRTVALEPDHYAAHRALGFLWMALDRRDRAMDHFARTQELRRGDDRLPIAADSLTKTTRGKIGHDAAQFRYLASLGKDKGRWDTLARAYDAAAKDIPENGIVVLTDAQFDLLGDSFNTPFYVRSAPELPGDALSDAMSVSDDHGIATIDNLLSDRALALLRRNLLESTIWSDFAHIDGFLASYLEDGLASPLLLQIADEIRTAFPDRLAAHPLTQGWAFKGIRGDLPIDIHADDAAVSVNFWVTPEAANANRDTGGLEIWRGAPPEDWEISDYGQDIARIRDWLAANPADRATIPYRENRAVLFPSRLFHGSHAPAFQPGYVNMRINITLLFGNAAA